MVNKIPDFKSVKEEKEFWDSHSSADYWDDMKECSDTFKRSKIKHIDKMSEMSNVRIPMPIQIKMNKCKKTRA